MGDVTRTPRLHFDRVDKDSNRVMVAADGLSIPIEAMSQGTASLLGWLGVLVRRLFQVAGGVPGSLDRPALVLIDELDAHMHPGWQQVLVSRLKERLPKVQFIATTHSPLVVAGLDAGQVARFRRVAGKGVVAERPLHGLQGVGVAGLPTSELFSLSSHFRPKNSVRGSVCFPLGAMHPGYWWLSFDYHNYRFCCTFCNSIRKGSAGLTGGKQAWFPVWDEGHRARSATDDQDKELPILLDPTNRADIGVLWFDESGCAVPRPQRQGEPDAGYRCWKERAEESITHYHLNHPDIREARQLLAQRVRWLAKEADKWLERLEKGEPGAHAEFAVKLDLLAQARKPKSEYSAAAHCVLRGMRGSSRVAEILLEQPH